MLPSLHSDCLVDSPTSKLQVLTSWWVIGVAMVLYLIEFFADKIPIVDSTWDVVHTFIRVPAGAVLAATAFGEFERSVSHGSVEAVCT